ncbi:MAG: bifunctional diaminohydroxyphosphoribosylaminopyrimidine deaminase/5-amino-6-(5-phosphoribosylamino)uracil reductase RibD [Nitrospinae bacterium]|nr:bifunctional diaminohydroxyphosphoribosylaminopyrimidine deaminase/5-amino-6-(5-phosphoribosylamino)uracil reductase RibD [Nitrospinota bacterium]
MKPEFMTRALQLAETARGRTSPNPMVGAVIVKGNRIIAEGFHQKAGGDHAEIVALKKAKDAAKGASLYVTLEPCCHHGKTPPCTDAIIKAGIKKVAIAAQDPNPLVCGKGTAQLKKAGVAVFQGLLQKEAKKLNEAYNKFITEKIPFVTLKVALSLDGKMADSAGVSKWISNENSRQKVHEMRASSDAVLVGVNTLLNDNPRLNARVGKKSDRQPVRVVADSSLRTPPTARILHSAGGEVWIATTSDDQKKIKSLEDEGAKIIRVEEKNKRVDLKALMKELAKRGIVSLLLEGGASMIGDAMKNDMVDKMALFYAPLIIGGEGRYSLAGTDMAKDLPKASRLLELSVTTIPADGPAKNSVGDVLVEGYVKK